MTPYGLRRHRQASVTQLIRIGAMLSNAAFNLQQGAVLHKRDRESLDELRRAWDEALSIHRALYKKGAK